MAELNIDQELAEIDSVVYHMLDDVINNYTLVIDYYKSDKYNPSIELDDDKINQLERVVESLCMQILLREKVYSGDLRKVCGNLKLVEDVERIGDQSWDILNITQKIKCLDDEIKVIPGMEQIISVVNSMIKDALSCYVKEDKNLAINLLNRDDIVDKDFEDIINTIIKLNEEKKISASNTVYQTLIVKYLERIADQSTNIAEWVVYIINGYHKDQQII